MENIDLRNPPNEMPDIVGYKPANPLAANFKPYISPGTQMRELTPVPLIVGHAARRSSSALLRFISCSRSGSR